MKTQNPKPKTIHLAAELPFKMPTALLNVDGNAKTIKGQASGYLTGILYLAPANLAGVGNLCPHASAGCLSACLFTAGFAGIYEAVNVARVMRTRLLHDQKKVFLSILEGEISAVIRRAEKLGLKPAIRLNGTSDLPWENLAPELFRKFSHIQFYDYTKSFKRAIAYAKRELPANYHLTFSLSESNATLANLALDAGVNVAAVVSGLKGKTIALPGSNQSRRTFDADRHDLRFSNRVGKDGRGRVGILTAKGKAKNDTSGFVLKLFA
jgi:hypothetical protein